MNDDDSDNGRDAKADNRIDQHLADNDLVNVVVSGTHRAQGGKLIEVIFSAGIECLCDDCGSHNDAEQCACKERCTGSGFKKPEREGKGAEDVGGEAEKLKLRSNINSLEAHQAPECRLRQYSRKPPCPSSKTNDPMARRIL